MDQSEAARRRPRIFNTPFETGLRSVVILTGCFPEKLSLHRLVVFDHLIVHTSDIDGPLSIHPKDRSRAAEILVRRGLVRSGLALMQTRGLVTTSLTPSGFRFQAGEEAGSFVDLLATPYVEALKDRAEWLVSHVLPLTDEGLADLVRTRMHEWAPEFQIGEGPGA
ncbi:ABC-three component system middle component 2 [Rhodoplanes sp.]|uniref:ABC-three component system middle component 2 n=1 Tax=Rhodoplanes sp. TaxID=1968906 RepID=UPI00345B74CD